jgi:hypothetical protein
VILTTYLSVCFKYNGLLRTSRCYCLFHHAADCHDDESAIYSPWCLRSSDLLYILARRSRRVHKVPKVKCVVVRMNYSRLWYSAAFCPVSTLEDCCCIQKFP